MIGRPMMDDPIPHPDVAPRYTDLPLPPYRFIPGAGRPHPMRAGGYMSEFDWVFEGVRPPRRWREQRCYLYGVDLFNRAYWWEAHEAWEALWHRTRDPIQHEYIHGLIQLAAGLLKWHLGRTRGVRVLSVKTIRRLKVVRDRGTLEGGRRYMGLDVVGFVDRLERTFRPFVPGGAGADAGPVEPIVMRLEQDHRSA